MIEVQEQGLLFGRLWFRWPEFIKSEYKINLIAVGVSYYQHYESTQKFTNLTISLLVFEVLFQWVHKQP